MRNAPRPTLREVVGIFGVITALQVFNLVTHQEVITFVITVLICGGVIGWWIWTNRYR